MEKMARIKVKYDGLYYRMNYNKFRPFFENIKQYIPSDMKEKLEKYFEMLEADEEANNERDRLLLEKREFEAMKLAWRQYKTNSK
jgi:hypothetical protein